VTISDGSARRLGSRAVRIVTEEPTELLARARALFCDGSLELAATNLQLLNGEHSEADRHIEAVSHEPEDVVPHAVTVLARQRGG
jgi:hypothetical protein